MYIEDYVIFRYGLIECLLEESWWFGGLLIFYILIGICFKILFNVNIFLEG